MEVHSHTHTERKKFTHYLWEFLMLFLAVFCGFLAENIREHQVDKKKGKQYIASFSADLKKDTIQCNLSIKELSGTTKALNNIMPCFQTLMQDIHATTC